MYTLLKQWRQSKFIYLFLAGRGANDGGPKDPSKMRSAEGEGSGKGVSSGG